MPTCSPKLLTTVSPFFLAAACAGGDAVAPSAKGSSVVAAAATPTAQTFEVPYAFDFTCPQGFAFTNNGIASGRETIFYSVGTPVRSLLRFALRGALTNTSTGKTLANNADFTISTDLLSGENSIAGASFHVVSKGHGIVVLDVGIARFDAAGNVTFEAGPHAFVNDDAAVQEYEALS